MPRMGTGMVSCPYPILLSEEIYRMRYPPRESGQSFLEYALILVLVVIVILLILRLLGPAIESLYQNVIQTV